MDTNELVYAKGVLVRLAQAASEDQELAKHVRELVMETGILRVFGESDATRPLELLAAGGEALLRERLGTLTPAELRKIVAANGYDPDKATPRWRSTARFVDLIATKALEQQRETELAQQAVQQQYEQQPTLVLTPTPSQPRALPGTEWML